MCKLHATSLSNALEELEQRVCASVLKMYLQVINTILFPCEIQASLFKILYVYLFAQSALTNCSYVEGVLSPRVTAASIM